MLKRLSTNLLLFFIACIMITPIAVVLFSWTNPIADIWGHLIEYTLPTVIKNTLLLLAMVIGIAGGLGVGLAWITSMYDFVGRKFFSWALMLPLAIPAYVLAFVAVGILDFSGFIATFLRTHNLPTMPAIRNIWGAGVVMSFVLYPYVYLLARQAFLSQGRRAIEAGRLLGQSTIGVFFKVALPQASPWIVGGLMLACMEALADFGAVSVFSVSTFTTAIYKTWFGLFDLTSAAQLASILIFFVFLVVVIEQHWQSKKTPIAQGDTRRLTASKPAQIAMFLACGFVFLMAFLLPIIQLIVWTYANYKIDFGVKYLSLVINSVTIASMTTVFVAFIGVVMTLIKRRYNDWLTKSLVASTNLGYAMPGTVLAVGVFIPIAWVDNWLIDTGFINAQVLSGSIVIMLIALSVRFMAVGLQPIDREFKRLTQNQESAAYLLSDSLLWRIRKLVLPVLRSGVFTALLMVFVEVIKEMPITLMTRRRGWDTLAVKVFEMTSEGMWGRAALPSLCIVLVGLVPVWLILRKTKTH